MATDDNTISIQVTATTDDLERGLTKATGEVREFGDGINDLAQRVQAVKPDAFKELAQQFNAGKLDLDEFRDGLIATTTATSAASTEAKALATSTAISSSAMREFTVIGRELASGNLTRLPGSLSILASRLGGISPAAILGAAGIAAFGYAIYEVIDSSEQFQKALTTIQLEMQASGRGGSYNDTFVTELINNFRQATDVSQKQAVEITQAFAKIRTLSQADLQTISDNLVRFKSVVGESSEEAAKELEKAFGGDTLAFIQHLSTEFGVYTPAQLEAAEAAKKMGDQATLAKIAMQGFLDVANNTTGENATGLAKYFNDIKTSLSGVNVEAGHARNALLAAAEAADKVGNTEGAKNFRYQASQYDSRTRNLPAYGSSAPTGASIDNSADAQKAKQQQETNDAVKDGLALAERSNAPLIEQEHHLEQITRLQRDLNAAVSVGNGDAAQKIQATIDQENKQYADRLKRQEPKQPKVKDDDSVDQMMLDDQKLDEAEIEGAAKVGQAKIKTAEDTAKEQYTLGQLTADQEAAQLTELAEQSFAIEQARFNQLAILYKDDAAKYEQVTAEKAQAEQRLQQQIAQIQATQAQRNTAMLNQEQQQNQQAAQRVAGPWENAFTEMTTGTRTWQQASLTAARQVETQFVSTIVKNMVNSWVSGELTKTLATMAGNAARTSSDTAAAAGAGSAAAGANKTTIMDDAWTAAANVYNNVSAIPYVGWALAPAAAAAAFAAVAGFGANISSAAGGMIVDSDQIAKVHENEMVLPARYTGGLTKMIDQANAGQAGGGANNHFHFSPQINGKLGPDDISGLHQEFGKFITKGLRNGQFGGMRTT